jgi:O-antigen biosynthesis protein
LFIARSLLGNAPLVWAIANSRDQFLLLLVKGLGGLEPKLYLDTKVIEKTIPSINLQPAKFAVYLISPALLENVQRIRLEFGHITNKIRVFGLTTKSPSFLHAFLWVTSRLRRTSLLDRTRIQFIGEHVAFTALQGALSQRAPVTRRLTAHFDHVVDLASEEHRWVPATLSSTQREPLISFVVPVFNTKREYLDDLLASFRLQPSRNCQLVLSDDGSTSPQTLRWLDRHSTESDVTVVRNCGNRGIAAVTNLGVTHSRGHWIGFVDHDDALSPFSTFCIERALRQAPGCQFLYTDEVIADRKLRPIDYFLKPSWDPVLLSGVNYINHLSLYRRDRLLKVGGLRDNFQGSQDYDLLLRYTSGLPANEILHLPYPAYIWRRDGASFSARFRETATANARRALEEHYRQEGCSVLVDCALSVDLHRIRFDLARPRWPLVSVVVPSLNAFHLISTVLEGLASLTDYPALEIIVIDNGSKDDKVLALYDEYRRRYNDFHARIQPEAFNFSRSVNRGIESSSGDFVLILNNDIEILEPNWLKEMISCFDYPGTGVVGAKLLYPNRTIQHVGVIAGLGGLAGHWFVGRNEDFPGPMGRLRVRQSVSIVTGACMLVSRECLNKTGPFDENTFAIAYNDVDFCLRAVSKGFKVVWTPFATLIHHESASRGSDETPDNIARFRREQRNLRDRHHTQHFEDRAFNPWYSKDRSDPTLALLDRLPPPR